MKTYQFTIDSSYVNTRADKYLCEKTDGLTRSYIQKLIEDKLVLANGQIIASNYKLKIGDEIEMSVPEIKPLSIEREQIPLDVAFEDSHVIVINKPQGMVVHPAAGNYSGTLVNALLAHCGDNLSGINGVARPGIVHRLDKDTSGLLIVAKTDVAHMSLTAQIKERTVKREYRALVYGNFKEDEGVVDAPIGRHTSDRKKMTVTYKNSREARTHYTVLERFSRYTLLSCRLETGRTHQIRVHMASISHPVVGDKTYGVRREEFNLKGQLLHSHKIGFTHPISGEYMEFSQEIPEYFAKILKIL